MAAPQRMAFVLEQLGEFACAQERMLQMQRPSDASASSPARSRPAVGSTPMSATTPIARTESLQACSPPDRSALGARAGESPERVGQKIAFHGELPDLGVQLLDALLRILGQRMAVGEQLRGVLENLLLPGGDLRGMDVMLLRQFGECFIAADSLQNDLGLEGRGMVSTGSLHGDCSFRR